MAANPILPRAQSFIAGNLPTTREWYDFFRQLLLFVGESNTIGPIIAEILERLAALEEEGGDPITAIQGLMSVKSFGPLEGGIVRLELLNDALNPGNTYYYGTGPDGAKGWHRVYDALATPNDGITLILDPGGTGIVQIVPADDLAAVEALTGAGLAVRTGDETWALRTIEAASGETTVANGNGVAGNPAVGLADVTPAAGGSILRLAFDAKGRRAQQDTATTTHLPEGTNLYYTDARADARITLQKGQPNGLATLDGSGKLDGGQLPALAITETFPVATEAAMLALTAQQGDVAVRTDTDTTYILTAEPASTLANWQELLTPTAGAVTSFNGRTGAVVPQSGDYTPAQVGAEPTIAAGTTAQYWRGDKTWRDFATDVRATVLTGLSTATNAAITAADTVLQALGKLQAQLNFSGALLEKTAVQSVPSGTATALTFDSETYDTDGYHDNVTNNSRLTVAEDGYYVVSACVNIQDNATGYRRIDLRKNGSLFSGGQLSIQNAVAGTVTVMSVDSAAVRLLAGDYVELFMTQTSGGAINVNSGVATWFAIRKLAN